MDPTARKPSEQDGVIRLLFVGVDSVRKGLVEVVEAFQTVQKKYRIELKVVSLPPAWLRDRIVATPSISLHTSSPTLDVKSMMQEADIFVLPTYADTYALAAVEALAHGCAVVVSDLEPLPEIIPDGQVGFTVPAGNIPVLIERLETLLTDTVLLRRMQGNAYDLYVQRHNPHVVAKQLRDVFESALSQ